MISSPAVINTNPLHQAALEHRQATAPPERNDIERPPPPQANPPDPPREDGGDRLEKLKRIVSESRTAAEAMKTAMERRAAAQVPQVPQRFVDARPRIVEPPLRIAEPPQNNTILQNQQQQQSIVDSLSGTRQQIRIAQPTRGNIITFDMLQQGLMPEPESPKITPKEHFEKQPPGQKLGGRPLMSMDEVREHRSNIFDKEIQKDNIRDNLKKQSPKKKKIQRMLPPVTPTAQSGEVEEVRSPQERMEGAKKRLAEEKKRLDEEQQMRDEEERQKLAATKEKQDALLEFKKYIESRKKADLQKMMRSANLVPHTNQGAKKKQVMVLELEQHYIRENNLFSK